MKILITGCRGQLGTELQKQLAAESCVLGPLPERLRKATIIPVDVDELDITDREATINYIRRHTAGRKTGSQARFAHQQDAVSQTPTLQHPADAGLQFFISRNAF